MAHIITFAKRNRQEAKRFFKFMFVGAMGAVVDFGALNILAHVFDVPVTIAGIITNEPEKRVFGVATTEEALPRIQDSTIILPIGSISGIASSILTECKIRGIPAYGLLGETINAPDPRASAASIAVINRMFDLNLDVQPLLEQAEEIESTMQKLSEQVQTAETMAFVTLSLCELFRAFTVRSERQFLAQGRAGRARGRLFAARASRCRRQRRSKHRCLTRLGPGDWTGPSLGQSMRLCREASHSTNAPSQPIATNA